MLPFCCDNVGLPSLSLESLLHARVGISQSAGAAVLRKDAATSHVAEPPSLRVACFALPHFFIVFCCCLHLLAGAMLLPHQQRAPCCLQPSHLILEPVVDVLKRALGRDCGPIKLHSHPAEGSLHSLVSKLRSSAAASRATWHVQQLGRWWENCWNSRSRCLLIS